MFSNCLGERRSLVGKTIGHSHQLHHTLVCLALILSLAACSRHQSTTAAPARIAVLRFENLTSDVSLDWMGRAASEIIGHEIGGSTVITANFLHASPLAQNRPPSAPGASSEAAAALAEGATLLVMGQVSLSRNHLLLDVTERDAATGKTTDSFTLTSPNTGDLFGLADAAARRISPQVRPFESKSNSAIAAFSRAIEDSDYAKVTGEYIEAVHADPAFASAWLSWAARASAQGDRAGAAKVLAEAQQHANLFSDLNHARLKLATAQLDGDRTSILAAMNEVGRLMPEDADNARAVGDQNFAARQFQAAAAAYRRLIRIAPNNPVAWNQLGYSLLYAGDYDGAMSALQTYQRLVPNEVNPIDSQGDTAFAFGRFSDAEKLYEQSAAKNPAFENSGDLYKAAEARLMTGDVAAADKKFEAYAAVRRGAKDPLLPFRTAQWRFLSGRHDEALALLAGLVAGSDPQWQAPQAKGQALTQMAIWNLQLGHRDLALRQSGDALKTGAASPSTFVARFASENATSAADWSARADRLLGAPQLAQLKPLALAYALYLTHQWQAAEPAWKQLVERSNPEDSVAPVLYARVLTELKRPRDAEPLVRLYPVPHPADQEFLSLAIPEFFNVRAEVYAAQGKTAESEACRKLFKTLWGPG